MTSYKTIIFSGPSGAGKTTIVKYLLQHNATLSFVISACTRPSRSNEVEGKDYYFLSEQEFKDKIGIGDFIEWEEVYEGSYYGTLKAEVERIRDAYKIPIFDVDVKGALQLKNYFKANALTIYIKPPSPALLAERLSKRNTELTKSRAERIERAAYEAGFADQFDIVLLNQALDTTLLKAQALVDYFLQKNR